MLCLDENLMLGVVVSLEMENMARVGKGLHAEREKEKCSPFVPADRVHTNRAA